MQTRKYVVVLSTNNLARKQRIEAQLKEYGQVNIIGPKNGGAVFSWDVATDGNHDAKTIRDGIRPLLDVFYDVLCVVRYNPMDKATVNAVLPEVAEAKGGNDIDGKRNFNRFSSRREAKAAYERERPNWWMKYGGGSTLPVIFEEWLWLPIRKDGVYERSENEKYL